jgi:hypothetical protein
LSAVWPPEPASTLGLLALEDALDRRDRERLQVDRVGDARSVMIVAGLELSRIVRTPSVAQGPAGLRAA